MIGLCLILFFSRCGMPAKISGLWLIEKVQVGMEEMTPVARWTHLQKSQSQTSGNGWQQHTIGSWSYDPARRQITITSEKGLKDEFDSFSIIDIDRHRMVWAREENGEDITVRLKRINEIPVAPMDNLLGAWRLTNNVENIPQAKSMTHLFFRWDRLLLVYDAEQKRKYSMYRPFSHAPTIQIIHYEDPLRLEEWRYSFENTGALLLEQYSKNDTVQLTFCRIYFV